MKRAEDARVEIGGIARAHGIKGEVVIVTHDPDSDTLGRVQTIFVAGQPRTITQARDTHRGWLIAFEGIVTRNDAEALQGAKIEVAREALELDDDEMLLSDLVGCKAVLADGTVWGEVAEVQPGELQDLLVIHHQGMERLLPLVDVFVTNIDVDAGTITVDPPEGIPESKLRCGERTK